MNVTSTPKSHSSPGLINLSSAKGNVLQMHSYFIDTNTINVSSARILRLICENCTLTIAA